MKAAFYYAWYPEHWQEGHHWNPELGEYDSSDPAIIALHTTTMQKMGIEAGIYSWWGEGHPTDDRLNLYLDHGRSADFRWAIYYELDQEAQRRALYIEGDLNYLRPAFEHEAYLRVDGKPVVFVYAPYGNLEGIDKWSALREKFGLYVSMTDVPEWWTKRDALDSWHGYRPATAIYSVYTQDPDRVYAISLSPGFWQSAEDTPRLERSEEAWHNGLAGAAVFRPEWELYTTFNEWVEGTGIEPSDAGMYDCRVVPS
jgi:hypothetical protein